MTRRTTYEVQGVASGCVLAVAAVTVAAGLILLAGAGVIWSVRWWLG